MGVTEEGRSRSDENKKKARMPTIKVMGLFCFKTTVLKIRRRETWLEELS